MVRTKKYASSRRRVAWLMFLPCFDVLCALSEYRPTAKWNLFVLYNNQDSVWPHFVSEHWSRWVSRVKNIQTKNNYRIILKNFTTIISKLTFIPEEILHPKILQHVSRFTDCDRLLAVTGFLSAYFGQLFPSLTCHNKISSFFNLVEVILNGLCLIFHRTVFLSGENLPVFVRYSKKQFAKLTLDWSRAPVTPLDDVNRASIL